MDLWVYGWIPGSGHGWMDGWMLQGCCRDRHVTCMVSMVSIVSICIYGIYGIYSMYGMYGMAWHGMAWFGMVWHLVWYLVFLVWYGT
jgi:uncharacterized membrane protein